MAKSATIDAAIKKLAALKLAPRSPEAKAELTKALASKVNYLAELAARFIRDHKLLEMTDTLATAYHHYADAGTDNAYNTRTELARTLFELGAETPEVYLAGVRARASIGPPALLDDPAASLRGICVVALARMGHSDALVEATDRLMDPSAAARVGAARALGLIGQKEAAMILRLKLHVGEHEAEVAGDMFSSLMLLDPQRALPLVSGFLDSHDAAIAEVAALALGESRRAEALNVLRAYYQRTVDSELRKPILLAIAVTRLPDAAPFLLAQVKGGDVKTAGYALEALRIYRLDDSLMQKLREVVDKRAAVTLREKFAKLFE